MKVALCTEWVALKTGQSGSGGVEYFGFQWCDAAGYNTGSNKAIAMRYDLTMAQYLRNNWNNPNSGNSPYKEYGGILVPDGRDENGDIIYRYAKKRKKNIA